MTKCTPPWTAEDTKYWEEFEELERQGKIKWITDEELKSRSYSEYIRQEGLE